jgi:DNA repair protein RadD
LSATPWRKGLGKNFAKLIKVSTTDELIKLKYLAPFRVFAPSHPDLKGIRTTRGDFDLGQLSALMQRPKLVGDVVSTYLRLGEDRKGFVFAVDCAHAQELQQRFNEAGVPCGYVDSHSTSDERRAVKSAYESGEIKLVANVNVMTTGIDWDVRIIIMARPTKSETLFVQTIGRGLRVAEGKADCLILDHSSNHSRFGFVTDVDCEALNDGQEPPRASGGDRDSLPLECTACGYLRDPGEHICPNCGFAPKRQSNIEWADGEFETHALSACAPRNVGVRILNPKCCCCIRALERSGVVKIRAALTRRLLF